MKFKISRTLLTLCVILLIFSSVVQNNVIPNEKETKLVEIETLILRINPNAQLVKETARALYEAAERYNICRRLLISVVIQESDFRVFAIGKAQEVGLMQIKPSTALYIADDGEKYDLFVPADNIDLGARYLKYCILLMTNYTENYSTAMELGITAYNRGPGRVMRMLEKDKNPRNGYEYEVLERRQKIFQGRLFD